MAHDLIEKVLTEADGALPKHGFIGTLRVPPELTPVRDRRGHEPLSVRVLVDQLNVRSKEPLHLITEPQLGISARVIDL